MCPCELLFLTVVRTRAGSDSGTRPEQLWKKIGWVLELPRQRAIIDPWEGHEGGGHVRRWISV